MSGSGGCGPASRVLRPLTHARASAQRIEELERALRVTQEIKQQVEAAYQEQMALLVDERDAFRLKYEKRPYSFPSCVFVRVLWVVHRKTAADLEALYARVNSKSSFDIPRSRCGAAIRAIRPRTANSNGERGGGGCTDGLVPALQNRISELETALASLEERCAGSASSSSLRRASRSRSGTFSVTPSSEEPVARRNSAPVPPVLSGDATASRAHDEMAIIKDLQKRLAAAERKAHEDKVRAELACANAASTIGTLELELSSLRARLTLADTRNAELQEQLEDSGGGPGRHQHTGAAEGNREPQQVTPSKENAAYGESTQSSRSSPADNICQAFDTMCLEELRIKARSLVLLVKQHEKAERALQQRLADVEASAETGPNVEYIRNSLLRFLESDEQQRRAILPTLTAILGFSEEERSKIAAAFSKKRWIL
eukprot:m51a1_g14867 hypothetical protein (430) ;mRNA; r:254208-255631